HGRLAAGCASRGPSGGPCSATLPRGEHDADLCGGVANGVPGPPPGLARQPRGAEVEVSPALAAARPLHPALETALAALLPTAEQTQLLRACLLDGDDARRAWIAYQARVPDLKHRFRDEPRSRRLAPLLLHALAGARAAAGRR